MGSDEHFVVRLSRLLADREEAIFTAGTRIRELEDENQRLRAKNAKLRAVAEAARDVVFCEGPGGPGISHWDDLRDALEALDRD